MILADTSVWVEHFRKGNADLARLLHAGQVACHEFVIGELGCGTLRNRAEIMDLLERLPRGPLAAHAEVMTLVESRQLYGRGLGWIDVHLLASARLASAGLWTLDRRLAATAAELGVTAS